MPMSPWAKAHYDGVAHDPEYLASRILIEVTENIAKRMDKLGVSQHELARRLGKTQPFISRLLNHGTNATFITLAAIADALDAEFDAPALVGRETRNYQEIQPTRHIQLQQQTWSANNLSQRRSPESVNFEPNEPTDLREVDLNAQHKQPSFA